MAHPAMMSIKACHLLIGAGTSTADATYLLRQVVHFSPSVRLTRSFCCDLNRPCAVFAFHLLDECLDLTRRLAQVT